jgi:2-dehydro-3-deoxyphosphogluconate aldolase/(4S)-4-hydroxy-2-oxoglutarate aldolase
MEKGEVLRRIAEVGVVPVVRTSSADEAQAAVEAIAAGGLPVAEVTMTVPGALDAILRLAGELGGEVLIGAGTVLSAGQARACMAAGAQFLVSPSVETDVIAACVEAGVAVMPGALTPTEVLAACRAGADVVKVFPCGAVGGPAYLRALKAPLPQVALMPTGGVSLATAGDYIRAGAFALGVGSELVDVAALRAGKPEKITEAARAYVEAVREARARAAN